MKKTPKQYEKLINKISIALIVLILPLIVIDTFIYKFSDILNYEYSDFAFIISIICILTAYVISTAFVLIYLAPYQVHFDMINSTWTKEYAGKISLKDFDEKVKEYQTMASNTFNKDNTDIYNCHKALVLSSNTIDYCSQHSVYLVLHDDTSKYIGYGVVADIPELDGKRYHLSFFDFIKFRKQIKKGKYDIFTPIMKKLTKENLKQGEG